MLNRARIFPITLNILVALSLFVGSAMFPSSAQADSVITVATDTDAIASDSLCSLREAITNANNNTQTHTDCVGGSGNDTIQFSDELGSTTIVLASTLPDISDAAGLTINGGSDIAIDGNNAYRIMVITGSAPVTLNQLTLTNANSGPSGTGGAIYNAGVLTVTNSTFTNNDGGVGGAIADAENIGITHISNSFFSGNTATQLGGAIFIAANPSVNANTITNSIFSNNAAITSASGGAIFVIAGDLTVTNSSFTGNSSVQNGGGIAAQSNVTIANSTFSANTAVLNGGGFHHASGTANVTNSTFSGNSAGQGGGIYTNNTTLNLQNTILANSLAGNDCYSMSGTPMGNNTNNLIEANAAGHLCHTPALSTDPNLGSLEGFPSYFPLNNGSPAINAGDDTVCAAAPVNNTSQNGISRPSGPHCDIGSYEQDDVAPSVSSIVRAHASPTALDNVDFTITFSEAVTGVDVDDMGLITTGTISDASIINVSGSGSSYTVTINTGAGSGTIRLDIFNNLSIQDLTGNSLSAGDFTNGEMYVVRASTLPLNSTATNDGWVLEISETRGSGGSMNSTASNFFLGDDLADRQYRAILHFNTAPLPDTAIVTSATLKIKKQGGSGTNPFNILGALNVSVRKPSFGSAALQLTDFKSAAGLNNVATFAPTPVLNWYSASLGSNGMLYLNRTGSTQFRLAFSLDDNNDNGNDFLKFFSGSAAAASRPKLIIEYYVP